MHCACRLGGGSAWRKHDVHGCDLTKPSGVDEELTMLGSHPGVRSTAERGGEQHRLALGRLAGNVDVLPGRQVRWTIRPRRKRQYWLESGVLGTRAQANAEGLVPGGAVTPPFPESCGSDQRAPDFARVMDPEQLEHSVAARFAKSSTALSEIPGSISATYSTEWPSSLKRATICPSMPSSASRFTLQRRAPDKRHLPARLRWRRPGLP